jgi:hypothetical protein
MGGDAYIVMFCSSLCSLIMLFIMIEMIIAYSLYFHENRINPSTNPLNETTTTTPSNVSIAIYNR